MESVLIWAANASISAGYLVIVILLLRSVLKKTPKWMNTFLWGLVGLRLLLPFSIESVWSLLPSPQTIPSDIAMDPNPGIYTGIPPVDRVVNPIIGQQFAPNVGDSANPLQIWLAVATVIWLIGIAVMLLHAVISYVRLRRKVSTAVWLRWRVYQCDQISSPFVFGFLKPRIYVPYGMDEEDLTYVIHHEDIHIQRRDHWWKPLGYLLLSICWFHPLMWVAYMMLCRDMELACDERAVKYQDDAYRAAYSQALLDCSVDRKSLAACPLAFGEVGVKQRIRSVLRYKKPGFLLILLAVLVCAGSFVGFATTPLETPEFWSLSREEKLQTFLDIQPEDVKSMQVDYRLSNFENTIPLRGEQLTQILRLLQQLPDQPSEEPYVNYVGGQKYIFSITLHSGIQFGISYNGAGQLALSGMGTYTMTQEPDWLTLLHGDFAKVYQEYLSGLSASNIRALDAYAFLSDEDRYENIEMPVQQFSAFLADLADAAAGSALIGWEDTGAQFDILCFRVWVNDNGPPILVKLGEKLWIGNFAYIPGDGVLSDWRYYFDLLVQQ